MVWHLQAPGLWERIHKTFNNLNFVLFYFSYSTPVPAWSCAWNDYDTNYIYCGLQNGTCLIFDVRNTDTYLKSIQSATGGSCPVISVAHVSPDPHGALRWDENSTIGCAVTYRFYKLVLVKSGFQLSQLLRNDSNYSDNQTQREIMMYPLKDSVMTRSAIDFSFVVDKDSFPFVSTKCTCTFSSFDCFTLLCPL